MKILILTPEFPPQFGGIGTHCYEMAKHWSRDADVTVLLFARRQIVANFAFRSGELKARDIAEILKAYQGRVNP